LHSLAECFFCIKRRENPPSLGIEDQARRSEFYLPIRIVRIS